MSPSAPSVGSEGLDVAPKLFGPRVGPASREVRYREQEYLTPRRRGRHRFVRGQVYPEDLLQVERGIPAVGHHGVGSDTPQEEVEGSCIALLRTQVLHGGGGPGVDVRFQAADRIGGCDDALQDAPSRAGALPALMSRFGVGRQPLGFTEAIARLPEAPEVEPEGRSWICAHEEYTAGQGRALAHEGTHLGGAPDQVLKLGLELVESTH